jgi:hypothetical protein
MCCIAERDKQLAEVKKENKAFKQEQSSWAKTQRALEAQVNIMRCMHMTHFVLC